MIDEKVKARGINAVSEYLSRKGYEIFDYSYMHNGIYVDIIAMYRDILVFIGVDICESFPTIRRPTDEERIAREELAIRYLKDHGYFSEIQIRFDEVHIIILGEGRALCRHEINIMD